MKRRLFTLSCLALLHLLSKPVLAQTTSPIAPDPGDNPLVIQGWLGEASVFAGSLRLTASADVPAFTFLASDLKQKDGDGVIGRQNVVVSGDPNLTAGAPKDFFVTVNGVAAPGTYLGQIELLQPGQARDEALVIPLQVEVRVRPALTPLPGSDQLHLSLVNCRPGLDCALARMLLPPSAFVDQRSLQLENAAHSGATILESMLVAQGQQTGYQLTGAQLSLPAGEQTLPARQIFEIPLKIDRRAIPPDRYNGSIYLTLEDRDERVLIPVDLNVRTGPAGPVLFLLFGILMGRLFKYMQERGEPQSQALVSVNEVEALIADAQPADRQALQQMVKRIRKQVYQQKLEEVEPQLKAVRDRFDALRKLRGIEASLVGKEKHKVVEAALVDIAGARTHLYNEQDEQAQQILTKVTESLANLSTTMGSGQQPDPSVKRASEQAAEAGKSAGEASQAPAAQPAQPDWLARLKRGLVVFSGLSDEIRAEATLWLVRPLLYLALLAGLLVVGLGTLYVDNGVTFGANPFNETLGLVLWGLSADVASRTLSNLRGAG